MTERGGLSLPPRRYSKAWLSFARLVEKSSAMLGGRAFYRSQFLAPGRFRVRKELVAVSELPAGLEGISVIQLSDLHGGIFMGAGDLRHVVDAILDEQPDVIVLTGDYIISHWNEVLGLLPDLERLRARFGVFAVFGNHDYRGRCEGRIAELFEKQGIRVLRNECARIDTGDGVLALVGLEDLEEAREVDEQGARSTVETGDVEIVLCHNPGGASQLARDQCAAVLSGHTHGNQINLPGFRQLGPHHPGARLQYGKTVAITNSGLGVIGIPFRFRAPAEIVQLTLVSGSQ